MKVSYKNEQEINNISLDENNDDHHFTDYNSSKVEIMFAGLIVFLVGSGLIIKYV